MTDDTDKARLPDAVMESLAYCSRFTTAGGNKVITGFLGGPLLMKSVTSETIKRRCRAAGIHLTEPQLHRCLMKLRGVRQEKRVNNSVGFVQRWKDGPRYEY